MQRKVIATKLSTSLCRQTTGWHTNFSGELAQDNPSWTFLAPRLLSLVQPSSLWSFLNGNLKHRSKASGSFVWRTIPTQFLKVQLVHGTVASGQILCSQGLSSAQFLRLPMEANQTFSLTPSRRGGLNAREAKTFRNFYENFCKKDACTRLQKPICRQNEAFFTPSFQSWSNYIGD